MIFVTTGQVIAVVREAWDMGYCAAIADIANPFDNARALYISDTGRLLEIDYYESESELFEAWVKNLVSHTGQRD